jgi:pimeloyl-ACP methyl ester carboxylesterase
MAEKVGRLDREDGGYLAWRRIDGEGPTIIWLGGFRSDMTGTKAQALSGWAQATGRDFLRFDYFAHGLSTGDFQDATITRWRADALAVIDEMTSGLVVLVGSSMGGWLACLAALARPERVAGMVLIAPAADFTHRLMLPNLSPEAKEALLSEGLYMQPSDYGEAPYPLTATLLADGVQWSIMPGPVEIRCPVRVLQGGQDPDVPWAHAMALSNALQGSDVSFNLIKDGDHRLSRLEDLEQLLALTEDLMGRL